MEGDYKMTKGIAIILTKWNLKPSFIQRVRRLIRGVYLWLKKHVLRRRVDSDVNLTRLVDALKK